MRIDGSLPVPENQQTQKPANLGASASQGRSAPLISQQDQTQLSVDSGTVQELKVKLSQLPDVRQERVNALRQALGDGSYQVSSQQLADAMGTDLLSSGQLRLT
jgi:negative regulator of flagellin synthesis FlgM